MNVSFHGHPRFTSVSASELLAAPSNSNARASLTLRNHVPL
jgi:hypothetical protein